MHILLPLLFLGLGIYAIILGIQSKNKQQADDSAVNSLRKKYDLIRDERLFNVDSFNRWFNAPKPKHIYAHSGIFGRTDKLSGSHFVDYVASFGLQQLEAKAFYDDNYKRFVKFQDEVRNDWMTNPNYDRNKVEDEVQG